MLDRVQIRAGCGTPQRDGLAKKTLEALDVPLFRHAIS
jgi:hypothetical protein